MASESSFDIVSDFDQQELVNALDQVRREVATRYDFKGSKVTIELGKDGITLLADDEYRANSVKDLIQTKAVRRNLSLKIFDWGRLEPAAGGTVRQHIGLRRGLTGEQAKELSKIVRERFPKVKPAIQGDAVRVSGRSRDELQGVIAHLKGLDYPVALQCGPVSIEDTFTVLAHERGHHEHGDERAQVPLAARDPGANEHAVRETDEARQEERDGPHAPELVLREAPHHVRAQVRAEDLPVGAHEHEAHAEEVVDEGRDDEAPGGDPQVGQAEESREQHEEPDIDAGGRTPDDEIARDAPRLSGKGRT